MSGEVTRRFRYAPTPSRELHVGNALSALVGWSRARAAGGIFILRIEDIDRQRCKPAYESACVEDLRWLGLDWDEGPDVGGGFGPYRQSARFEAYDELLERLLQQGVVYRCICSRADLARHVRAPHASSGGEQPYPGICRNRSVSPAEPAERGGFRLNLNALGLPLDLHWEDGFLGACEEHLSETCGDFLLGRPGYPTYQLAAVADDIHMGVTDVVRGRDLASSSARQIILHQTFGSSPPTFAHHPLILDEAKRKLSKRDEDATIGGLRRSGLAPDKLIGALMKAINLNPRGLSLSASDCIDLLAETPNWSDGEWNEQSL